LYTIELDVEVKFALIYFFVVLIQVNLIQIN